MSHPTTIGRYHVVGHLAAGGMAEILLGKLVGPSGFERPVVIKRILPNLARQDSFVNMFLDEARIVARIQHPNVVHVHELGRDNDELFMVMEYLEGESLASLQRRARAKGERVDRRLSAHIVAQACAGLHAAHELKDDHGAPLGLVHRDISPQNIFITYAGVVKLLDFGVAKFDQRSTDTEAGQTKGKFPFMSPEQCLGAPLDRRSDVFSLGSVLFELTTGRRLFARDSTLKTMKAITEAPIPNPTQVDPAYPATLARICVRALQRDRERRFQTAAEMRRDLIGLTRELELEDIPEEALSKLMHHLFADRVEAKQELLRRVKSGSTITEVPEAEVDASSELPTVSGQMPRLTPSTPLSNLAELSSTAPPPPFSARRWLVPLVAALVLLGLGVGLGAGLSGGGEEAAPVVMAAPPPPQDDPVEEAPVEDDTGDIHSSEAESAEEPATIMLRVESTPARATVSVQGERIGQTPLSLELEVGDDPMEVSIERRGYDALVETIVPSEDREIVAELRRSARAGRTTTMTTRMSEAPAMTGSPFRRFN